MKKIIIIFIAFISLGAYSQVIRVDTISESPLILKNWEFNYKNICEVDKQTASFLFKITGIIKQDDMKYSVLYRDYEQIIFDKLQYPDLYSDIMDIIDSSEANDILGLHLENDELNIYNLYEYTDRICRFDTSGAIFHYKVTRQIRYNGSVSWQEIINNDYSVYFSKYEYPQLYDRFSSDTIQLKVITYLNQLK